MLGSFPVTVETSRSGRTTRFSHGGFETGHTLELTFASLSQEDAKLIRDHYRYQQGGWLAFNLSSDLKAGMPRFDELVSADLMWTYSGPLEETHNQDGRVTISVVLTSTTTSNTPYPYPL